jgi:hypothetical protein
MNIHRKYLINKISLVLFFLLIIVSFLINFASIFSINNEYNWFDKDIATSQFLETYLLFFKLVVINLNCYLFGYSFNKEQDSYHLLITGYSYLKVKYIITKLLMICIIMSCVLFISIYIMLLQSIFCSNLILINKNSLELFINLVLICLIYGSLSSIFSMLFNNNYAYFLGSMLFVIGELIKDYKIVHFYFVFFPSVSISNFDSGNFGIIHLSLLFIIYAFLVVLGYVHKK